jgi:mono/diheme cytochrome c family protein
MIQRVLAVVLVLSFGGVAYADGEAVYKAKCKGCHGAEGKGTKMAPNAIAGMDAATVKKAVTEGKGKMKPLKLEAADVDAVAEYVAGLKK